MMILDFNQVAISNLMVTLGKHISADDIQVDLIRHFILNSIRSYNSKHRNEYGPLVIACDDGYSWRKSVFPYYKANRKKGREESKLDWNAIFTALNTIREELREVFPYRVVKVVGAEADDVIATLCHQFGDTNEKILIVSGDRDFRQLQSYINVRQFDPVRKRWMTENQPERYLKEHVMRGDVGDGVPNFLSKDDCLVLGERQKPIMEKRLKVWLEEDPSTWDETMLRGFRRNEQLIDLWKIPQTLQDEIMTDYEGQGGKDRSRLFEFFIEKRLKNLTESLGDF